MKIKLIIILFIIFTMTVQSAYNPVKALEVGETYRGDTYSKTNIGGGLETGVFGMTTYVQDVNGNYINHVIVQDGNNFIVHTGVGNIIFDWLTCKQIFLPEFNPIGKAHQNSDEAFQKIWTVEKLQGQSFVEQELTNPTCTLINNGNSITQTLTGSDGSYLQVITDIEEGNFKDTASFCVESNGLAGKEYALVEKKLNHNFNKLENFNRNTSENTEIDILSNGSIDANTIFPDPDSKLLIYDFNGKSFTEDFDLAGSEFSGMRINNGAILTEYHNGSKVLGISECVSLDPVFEYASADSTHRLVKTNNDMSNGDDCMDMDITASFIKTAQDIFGQSGSRCYGGILYFDLSSLPPDITVYNSTILNEIRYCWSCPTNDGDLARFSAIDKEWSGNSAADMYADLTGNVTGVIGAVDTSPYIYADELEFFEILTEYETILNSQAHTDIENAVGGTFYVGLLWATSINVYDFGYSAFDYEEFSIEITYALFSGVPSPTGKYIWFNLSPAKSETLGGIYSFDCDSGDFVTGFYENGTVKCATP